MPRPYKFTTTTQLRIARENVENMGNYELGELIGLTQKNTKALLKRYGIKRSESAKRKFAGVKANIHTVRSKTTQRSPTQSS